LKPDLALQLDMDCLAGEMDDEGVGFVIQRIPVKNGAERGEFLPPYGDVLS
jgi:hypothetical protein